MPEGHSGDFAMVGGGWGGSSYEDRESGTPNEDLLCFPVEIVLTPINSRKK